MSGPTLELLRGWISTEAAAAWLRAGLLLVFGLIVAELAVTLVARR